MDKEQRLKERLEELRAAMLEKFCPVTKQQCRSDCICFQTGYIETIKHSNAENLLHLYKPHCTYVAINGILTVENNY